MSTKVLAKLTYAALVTLLMITVAGNLPSLATRVPQEFVSVAQLFALFAVLLLALALLVPAVILRERTAMSMGLERWRDMNRMLRVLSKLAFLAAAVALDRLIPYLTGGHRGDGEPRVVTTFIEIVVDRILPYFTGLARGHRAVQLVTTIVAVALASWWFLGRRTAELPAPNLGTVVMGLSAMLAAIALLVIACSC